MSYERRVATKSDDAAATVAREKRAAMMRRAHEALKSGATTPATLETVERHNTMLQKINAIIHQHADALVKSNTSCKNDLANVKANTLSAYNWDFKALKGCEMQTAQLPGWWLLRSDSNAPKGQRDYEAALQRLIAGKEALEKELATSIDLAPPTIGSSLSSLSSGANLTAEQRKSILSTLKKIDLKLGPARVVGSRTPLLGELIHENLKKVK